MIKVIGLVSSLSRGTSVCLQGICVILCGEEQGQACRIHCHPGGASGTFGTSMGFRDRLRFGFGSRGVRREAGRRRDARFLCCCGPFSLYLFSVFVSLKVWFDMRKRFLFFSRGIYILMRKTRKREREMLNCIIYQD